MKKPGNRETKKNYSGYFLWAQTEQNKIGGRNIREEGVDIFLTDREKSRRKLLISKTRNEKNI